MFGMQVFFFLIAFNPQLVGCANVEPVGTGCRLSHGSSPALILKTNAQELSLPAHPHTPRASPLAGLAACQTSSFPNNELSSPCRGKEVGHPASASYGWTRPRQAVEGLSWSEWLLLPIFLQFCNFPNCFMSGPALEFDSV